MPSLLLGDNDMFKFYSIRYKAKGTEEWQALYLPSMPNTQIKDGVTSGETVYKIAEKEEEPTGLAALFSGMFTNRQVNRQNRNWRNQNGGNMPDFGSGNMPDFNGSFPGGSGSGGSSRPGTGGSGGSRGN